MDSKQNLYEKIESLIGLDSSAYKEECYKLADSQREDDQELCFLVAAKLRKIGSVVDSYDISKYLSQKNPSLKSYNIYLISTYDLTRKGVKETQELYDILMTSWKFYKEFPYEPNITATILKCCNYLIQNKYSDVKTVFDEVYEKCPEEERKSNSFIIAQYFKRLIAEDKEQYVIELFNQLKPQLQTNKTLSDIVKRCNPQWKPLLSSRQSELSSKISKKLTLISNRECLAIMENLLRSFSLGLSSIDLDAEKLIDELNQNTYGTNKALIIIPEPSAENEILTDKWAFIYGYCVHKFGKNNTILMVNKHQPLQDSVLSQSEPIVFDDEMDIIRNLGELRIISG